MFRYIVALNLIVLVFSVNYSQPGNYNKYTDCLSCQVEGGDFCITPASNTFQKQCYKVSVPPGLTATECSAMANTPTECNIPALNYNVPTTCGFNTIPGEGSETVTFTNPQPTGKVQFCTFTVGSTTSQILNVSITAVSGTLAGLSFAYSPASSKWQTVTTGTLTNGAVPTIQVPANSPIDFLLFDATTNATTGAVTPGTVGSVKITVTNAPFTSPTTPIKFAGITDCLACKVSGGDYCQNPASGSVFLAQCYKPSSTTELSAAECSTKANSPTDCTTNNASSYILAQGCETTPVIKAGKLTITFKANVAGKNQYCLLTVGDGSTNPSLKLSFKGSKGQLKNSFTIAQSNLATNWQTVQPAVSKTNGGFEPITVAAKSKAQILIYNAVVNAEGVLKQGNAGVITIEAQNVSFTQPTAPVQINAINDCLACKVQGGDYCFTANPAQSVITAQCWIPSALVKTGLTAAECSKLGNTVAECEENAPANTYARNPSCPTAVQTTGTTFTLTFVPGAATAPKQYCNFKVGDGLVTPAFQVVISPAAGGAALLNNISFVTSPVKSKWQKVKAATVEASTGTATLSVENKGENEFLIYDATTNAVGSTTPAGLTTITVKITAFNENFTQPTAPIPFSAITDCLGCKVQGGDYCITPATNSIFTRAGCWKPNAKYLGGLQNNECSAIGNTPDDCVKNLASSYKKASKCPTSPIVKYGIGSTQLIQFEASTTGQNQYCSFQVGDNKSSPHMRVYFQKGLGVTLQGSVFSYAWSTSNTNWQVVTTGRQATKTVDVETIDVAAKSQVNILLYDAEVKSDGSLLQGNLGLVTVTISFESLLSIVLVASLLF